MATRSAFSVPFVAGALALACNALLALEEKKPGSDRAGAAGEGETSGGGDSGTSGTGSGRSGASGSNSRGGGSAEGGASVGASGGEAGEGGGSGGTGGKAGCATGTFDHDSNPETSCRTWSDCAPGQYLIEEGTSMADRVCAACDMGTFTDEENTRECADWQDCEPGERMTAPGSSESDRQCDDCPAGTYGTTTNAETCAPCASGTYSAVGATACTAWTTCAPGTYIGTPGSVTRNQECSPCPSGTQSTSPNQTMCLPPGACPAGTEQTAPATETMPAQCADCPAGNYCAGGTTPRAPCSGETWDHDGNAGTACTGWTTCAAGTRVAAAGSSTSNRTCAACANGTYSTTTNATSCTAWTNCTWALGGVAQPGTATSNTVCGAASPYRQFGTSSSDYATAVVVAYDENVYVAGYTGGSLSGASAGSFDAYVRKYDSAGTIVWTRQFGTSSADYVTALAVDGSGGSTYNIYIAGYTEGSLNGTNLGMQDGYVSKYDSNGNHQWTRQFGTSLTEYVHGVAVDSSGNVYVAGLTQGALTGTNFGSADSFVRKYSSSGGVLLTEQFGTTSSDRAHDVAVDGSGNVYVVGFAVGALASCTPSACSNAGADDAYVRKYNSNLAPLWTRQFGTTASDYARTVAVARDGSGDVWVAGETQGALLGPNAGLSDAFWRRYSSSGASEQTFQFGTSGTDTGGGVAIGIGEPYYPVYVAGHTEGNLGGPSAGNRDAYRRTDLSGATGGTLQFGTASEDRAEDVAVGPNSGIVYVVGRTSGALVGTNAGGIDAFIRRQ